LLSKSDFKVVVEIATSHFPIITTIEGPSYKQDITEYTKIVWEPNKADRFRQRLDFCMENNQTQTDIEYFTRCMIESAEFNNMKKIRQLGICSSFQGPRWFDKSSFTCKKQTKAKLRNYRKCSDQSLRDRCKQEYLIAQRYYVNYTRSKKRKFFTSLDLKLSDARNTKELYSALSYYRPKHSYEVTKEHVSTDNFRKFYSNRFSKTESSQYQHETTTEDIDLDKDFDFLELTLSIKNLSKGKAAGPDTIVNEMWINLSLSHRLMLLDCINKCWRDNKLPTS
jgi:hypothetical protein